MVFNGESVVIVLFIGIIVWITIVSVLVLRMIGHYNKLTGGVSKFGLKELLTALLDRETSLKRHVSEIERELSLVKREGVGHIQKLGIVRFNPFSDTGGSQSITLAILDGRNNGIVMTSLYARTGNRWYVKEVKDGHGSDLELSKEELMAVKKANELVLKVA